MKKLIFYLSMVLFVTILSMVVVLLTKTDIKILFNFTWILFYFGAGFFISVLLDFGNLDDDGGPAGPASYL